MYRSCWQKARFFLTALYYLIMLCYTINYVFVYIKKNQLVKVLDNRYVKLYMNIIELLLLT